ncbi:dolichyl-phosphate-mannose--protein mannosyltransferase [Anaeramoeba flamelloides]|uniref:Dolichyl-phosphate-mannose--protein mannosyltransferase n=1 Tax=Anaeramoeba flamelloides TaxID=1746091 RepID=A0ABQ8X7Z9_9EUKA|nr:dolichyl-phosphate-mannose--protein mannosyltransferase [Anaeramoeba flamelloides]
MSSIARQFGYDPYSSEYEKIGDNYNTNDYLKLRFQPAFISALIPTILYLSLRISKISKLCSILGAVMIIFENSIITESRIIVMDAFLLFFVSLVIFFTTSSFKAPTFSIRRFLLFSLSGLALGCGISTKLTTLGTFMAVGILQLFQITILQKQNKRKLSILVKDLIFRGVAFLLPIAVIILISYYFHFNINLYKNSENSRHSTLFNNKYFDNENFSFPSDHFSYLPFFQTLIELNKVMNKSNMRISSYHIFASSWAEWPLLNSKAIIFWDSLNEQNLKQQTDMHDNKESFFVCIGNQ